MWTPEQIETFQQRNAALFAKNNLRKLIVELMRAVNSQSYDRNMVNANGAFWECIANLSRLDPEEQVQVVEDELKSCIDDARKRHSSEHPVEMARDNLTALSVKVVAEKISGTSTQLSQSEFEVLGRAERLIAALEAKRAE